jgi:hypothetical protein
VTGWLALASITPTGGLLGSGIALVVGSGGGRRRTLGLVSTVVLLQLTWLMPALLGSAALTSDPRGVAAFAARAERPGGAWLSLLGLGGVWDSGSTPVSRGGALGYLTTLVVLAAVLVGMRRLRDLFDAGTTRRLAVLALLGLLLSAASSIPVLEPVMRWVVDTIPGAGLLRDAQKWLLPFVLLATLCLGACADACLGVLRRRSRPWVLPGVVVTLALPMLLLPDAAATVWPTLDPVTYPSDFSRVAGILSRPHAAAGELVTLPWRSYRRFDWNRQVSTFDPAAQWFDREVVTSDELVVGTTHLRGEDPDASRVGAAVTSGRPMSSALPRLGVRWVLVYRDDPAVSALDLSGLHRRYAGSALSLYRARGPLSASAAADQPAAWDRVVVIVLDGLALLIVLAAAVASVTVGFQTRRHV